LSSERALWRKPDRNVIALLNRSKSKVGKEKIEYAAFFVILYALDSAFRMRAQGYACPLILQILRSESIPH
jgi:hypothetical protein